MPPYLLLLHVQIPSLQFKLQGNCFCDKKVSAKRIIAGKWGCNNGQTCIAPDYIITTKAFAPKLVRCLRKLKPQYFSVFLCVFLHLMDVGSSDRCSKI